MQGYTSEIRFKSHPSPELLNFTKLFMYTTKEDPTGMTLYGKLPRYGKRNFKLKVFNKIQPSRMDLSESGSRDHAGAPLS